MIDKKYFSREHIDQLRGVYGGDPALHEKCIYAFALLVHLTETGLEFVFKGGTSLLLHVDTIKRLSIDIDVMSPADGDQLNEVVDMIAHTSPFIRGEEDLRGARGLPMRRHFKFFFESLINQREDYVILDVVEESQCNLVTEEKEISVDFLKTDPVSRVNVLTVDSLLGDKLTAFAPNTVGVPYVTQGGRSMTMQVVKQLFDVGVLFDVAQEFDQIKAAFDSSYEREKTYREQNFSRNDVLNDIIQTGLGICGFNLRGAPKFGDSSLIIDGVQRLQNHLLREPFKMDRGAKIAASKAVLLASALRHDAATDFDTYTGTPAQVEFLREAELPGAMAQYARLKQVLPDAFYYLSKVTA